MEYSILERLPDNGQRCLCYGHSTYCCSEDMEELPAWHDVTFRINFSSYSLKQELPEDPEESIFHTYKVRESWDGEEGMHVIGVTKWKYLI